MASVMHSIQKTFLVYLQLQMNDYYNYMKYTHNEVSNTCGSIKRKIFN